jgi:hypothetical protein
MASTAIIRRTKQSGVVALTTILAIGLLVLVFGVALGFLSFLEGIIGFSQAKSQEAFFASQSGASDALMRLARDKTFSSAGYTINIGQGTSTIVVLANNPIIGQNLITSTGEASGRKRKIEVKVAVDNTSGHLTIISWREVSL